jgi:hypothetical protein
MLLIYCRKCGFNNSINDNYCGGCGRKLGAMPQGVRPIGHAEENMRSKKYSADDINELLQGQGSNTETAAKKKIQKKNVEVSQDFLDDIFNKENP